MEQSPTPTINRKRVRLNFSVISQFCRRGGAWLRPPLPCPLAQKITPAPLAGLQCRPLQAKGKACAKILPLFQNFIVGASIARPPLPHPPHPKNHPRTVAGLQCRPLQAKGKAYAKILSLFQNFIVGAGLCSARPCRTRRPKKITPAPRGKILPAPPKRPFCRKNENSLKNLPHAANKLTLVSVTFHPRAFIINLSKHCLPRVQNGAAAWF